MNHFDYRNGVLHAEAVNLIELAEAVGTPFYCYSTATLERHYRVFTEAFAGEKALVCYAMKANSNQSVLRTLAKLGAGADVVSGGELKRALAAGVRGFVPKTSSADEFAAAIRAVYEGKRYIDADLAAAAISTADSPLTAREAEVLEASGTGRPVEEIAASVHLAVGTTRNYLSSAMSKVGAANRFEAYMRARELGWL